MKKLIFVIVSLLLIGCEEKKSYQKNKQVCNCEEREKLQQFVANGIKPANNMSDEEMEDVIIQLEQTGINLFCREKMVWVKPDTFGAVDYTLTKLDSCEFVMD